MHSTPCTPSTHFPHTGVTNPPLLLVRCDVKLDLLLLSPYPTILLVVVGVGSQPILVVFVIIVLILLSALACILPLSNTMPFNLVHVQRDSCRRHL